MTQQAKQLIAQAKADKLTRLDLGNCGLRDLEKEIPELFDLTDLEELVLSNEWEEWNEAIQDWEEKKSSNNGTPNKIDQLPDALGKLTELRVFICGGIWDNGWGIKDVGPLSGLTNLTTLNLCHNKLTDVSALSGLAALTKLYLGGNQLTDVSALSGLAALTTLDLHSNQLTDVSALSGLAALTELYLWNNQLTDVSALSGLAALTTLDLGSNQLTDVSGLSGLAALTTLDLQYNELTDVSGLSGLAALTTLDLQYNELTDVSGLSGLAALTTLDLQYNELTDVSGLSGLAALTTLNLHYNQLTDVSGLSGLAALTTLNLHYNQLTDVSALSGLAALTKLYLAGNELADVSGLSGLAALTTLDLVGNELTDVSALSGLAALTELYLWNNQLTDVSALSGLSALTTLDLTGNELTDVSALSGLSALTTLDLTGNELTDVSALSGLSALTTLDLSDNELTDVSALLPLLRRENPMQFVIKERHHTREGEINVKDNPLQTPPLEIVEQGREAVLRYFKEELCYKYEGKLLIVGEPMSGKTTLLQKLLDPKYPVPNSADESTIGIQVKTWQFKDADCKNKVRINVWDFGGQEIQYLTHQFFLSANAVYALLVSPRKDSDNVDYWFNIIALLGKDDDGKHSQVLAVLNEIQNKETGKSTIDHFEEKRYHSDYPELPLNIRTVNFSKDDQRFEAVVCELKRLLRQLPQMGARLPVKWNKVRKALAGLQRNYISLAEYLQLCAKKNTDETLANILLAYLHQIGEVVHFKNDPALSDFIVLNPKWAVDAVYSVLKNKGIEDAAGCFLRRTVYDIWKTEGYKEQECHKLLQLMSKDSFEVAYSLPNKPNDFIAPQLLGNQQPDYTWEDTTFLQFRYWYAFRPKGIVTRLIVRMHEHIWYPPDSAKGIVWKTGVVFDKYGCKAQVMERHLRQSNEQVIDISISGNPAHRHLLLKDVCEQIEKIHGFYPNINFDRKIPCICATCKKESNNKHFYRYATLRKYIARKESTIKCEVSIESVSIKDLLLDAINIDISRLLHKGQDNRDWEERLLAAPFSFSGEKELSASTIFISYAKEDLDHLQTLKKHLSPLVRSGSMQEPWHDREVLAGSDWDAAIQSKLNNSDVVFILVSADYFNTENNYIWEKEMPRIMERHQRKEVLVVPIIMRDCLWEENQWLSKLQAVTAVGKDNKAIPLLSAANKDEAFANAGRQIKRAIDGFWEAKK